MFTMCELMGVIVDGARKLGPVSSPVACYWSIFLKAAADRRPGDDTYPRVMSFSRLSLLDDLRFSDEDEFLTCSFMNSAIRSTKRGRTMGWMLL